MAKVKSKEIGLFGSREIRPCFFCGEKRHSKLLKQNIGISFGMAGDHYNFCIPCLERMVALDFWLKLHDMISEKFDAQ